MYYKTVYQSPVGTLTLACDETGGSLVGLWIEGQKYYGGAIRETMTENSGLPGFGSTKKWLAPVGSEFRQEVWAILREIPYGKVTTYGDIAKKAAANMGRKSMSGQAVGGAVGHNPISIIIPCHRVIGGNGSLTGYAGGIQAKIQLLELEGVDLSRMSVPKTGSAL